MPIFEDGIRTLIKHKNSLTEPEKLVHLPSLNFYDTAINKWLLSEHLSKNNILGPKSVLIENKNQINATSIHIRFPVIAKPVDGFGGGQGVQVFETINAFQEYYTANKINYNYILQEYIKGDDMGCNVLCKDGEILVFTMQRGNLWSNNPYVPQIGHEFLYDKNLYTSIKTLMKSLNWSGVACVDIRYDTNTKQFYIIEINTRYWRSLIGSLSSGVNFPYLQLLSSLNLPFENPQYNHIKYLNLKGLINTIKKNPLFLFQLKFIWNNTPLKFAIIDPLPMIYKFISRQRNLIKRWF